MERLIDANALKVQLQREIDMYYNEDSGGIHTAMEALDEIDNAPTVEAEPKWIPVTERLPKSYEHVLVSKKKEEGFEPISVGYFFKNPYSDDIMFDDFLGTCCRYLSTDILAWMPMPKPYEVKK